MIQVSPSSNPTNIPTPGPSSCREVVLDCNELKNGDWLNDQFFGIPSVSRSLPLPALPMATDKGTP